ncbi:MAG: diguanylate cyclase [Thiobacillaceae bacterium]|nr:diguanylate cyclase [Thiobacillaceae bacterium]
MIDANRLQELKLLGRLPSPPRLALDLVERLKQDDVSLPEVCRLIQADPVLTGRLLKVANSPAYARPRPVLAIGPDVLVMLGLSTVRNLVLVFALIDGWRQSSSRLFDLAAFWSQAMAEACAAQRLGSVIRSAPASEMFTLGLVADIGRLGLATLEPQRYDDLLAAVGPEVDKVSLLEAEREAFGFDHAELTAAMLNDWGFPKLFCEAARCHVLPESDWPMEPDSRAWGLAELLAVAHRLAASLRQEDAQRLETVQSLAPRAAQMGVGSWIALADLVLQDWRAWAELMQLPAPSLTPFVLLAERLPSASAVRVLVVEDDAAARRLLEGVLAKAGYEVRVATDGEIGLALAMDWLPDIVLTDLVMPNKDGLALIEALRARPEGEQMYVVVISVVDAVERLAEAFDRGADDYVVKPLDARVLLARLKAGVRLTALRRTLMERNLALAEALARSEQAAMTDYLTGLPNRRFAMHRLDEACALSERSGHSLSLLLIDVDHFKAINDRYGHAAGDAVLVEVGQRLRTNARQSDVVCRIGGEEFLIIAPDTPLTSALRLAERVREAFVHRPVHYAGETIQVHVSIGVADCSAGCRRSDRLLKAADAALYQAKRSGRNTVACVSCTNADPMP